MMQLKYYLFSLLGVFFVFLSVAPHAVSAADLEVSGWIPYWAVSKGTQDAARQLEELSIIHPFGYSIKTDGTLHDLMGIKKNAWRKLLRAAEREDVKVIPTVMASDGVLMHTLLSDYLLRTRHIEEIVKMVEKGKYDGVDIDYEAKKAETKDFFSLFLKELKEALGDKLLTCTVEARTPPDSLYRDIPQILTYANDYHAIGTYCDQVEIMAYDQRRADIKLNDLRLGEPYMPVSDIEWVRKVVVLAAESIPKEKLVLGIPTYGHEYEITVAPNWYRDYHRIGAINPPKALSIAKKQKTKPGINRAGEANFSYVSNRNLKKLLKPFSSPSGTSSGNEVASQALAYANATGNTFSFNLVSWSNVNAVKQKVDLARELELRGVALFKIDGEEDRDIWKLFEKK